MTMAMGFNNLMETHERNSFHRSSSVKKSSHLGNIYLDYLNSNSNSNSSISSTMMMMTMMEKRQLFLRSYQFRRKKSFKEKLKQTLLMVKRVLWFRLRSARRYRKVVWSKLRRFGFCYRRKRRFTRLPNANNTSSVDYYATTHSCLPWQG